MGHFGGHFGTVPLAGILAEGRITRADVERLRLEFRVAGIGTADEAEALVVLDGATTDRDPAWPLFLAEALAEYIVRTAAPEGYVSAANARWLLDRMAPGGRIASKTMLDVVLRVLASARWVPIGLALAAMEAVRLAVVEGRGPLRDGGDLPAGRITARDVEILRGILYAFAGYGYVPLTRDEAKLLAAIDDATAVGTPNADWIDLYVKAMANAALSASGYGIGSRERALARSAPTADGDDRQSATALRRMMLAGGYGDVLDDYAPLSVEDRTLARLERQRVEIITGEEIQPVDPDWLAARIGRGEAASVATAALADLLAVARDRLGGPLAAAIECRQTLSPRPVAA